MNETLNIFKSNNSGGTIFSYFIYLLEIVALNTCQLCIAVNVGFRFALFCFQVIAKFMNEL